MGSIPTARVKRYGGCGEVVNTSDCGSDIRGFDSPHSPIFLGYSQAVRQGTLTPSCVGSNPATPVKFMPAWRNWQTRWTQNPVSARTCRFDPGRRYRLKDRIFQSCLFCFQITFYFIFNKCVLFGVFYRFEVTLSWYRSGEKFLQILISDLRLFLFEIDK